jgi:hypothetical protein
MFFLRVLSKKDLKEQESCDNSYRLSKAGQDARDPPPDSPCVLLIPKFPSTVKPIHFVHDVFLTLLINKPRTKEKTYICVSV